ncbi:MAG: glycosyltransferase family 39 protein [Nitrososphaerota archaeon]|nr:glycosyltransferase family 39 protein [Nitrososphaerota archaeon]
MDLKVKIIANKWRLLFLGFVVMYVLIILVNLTKTPIQWDEICHLNSGSMLYMGRYSDFINNAFYPPLFDVITWAFFKILGISLFVARLPAVLFAALALWAVFEIAYYMYNGKTALLSAVMLGIMPGFFWLSTYAMLETILIFFVTIALLFFYRWLNTRQDRMLFFSSLALGLGFLAKYQTPIIAGLIIAFSILVFARKTLKTHFKKLVIGITAAVLVIAPGVIIAYKVFKSEFISQWLYVLQEGNPGRSVYSARFPLPVFYLIEMVWPYPNVHPISVFCYILGLAGLAYMIYRHRQQDKFILIWFAVVYVFFTIVSNKDWRYVTPLFPAVAIAAATLMISLGEKIQKEWKKPRVNIVKKHLVKVTSAILITTMAGAMVYSVHDTYSFTIKSYVNTGIKNSTIYVCNNIEENKSIMLLSPFNTFNKDMVQFFLWTESDRDTKILQYPSQAIDTYVPDFNLDEFTQQCRQNNVQYIIFNEHGGATKPYYPYDNSTLNLRQIYEQLHSSENFTKINIEQTFGDEPNRTFIISFTG